MKAIVLAAGYATRLYPLTLDQPKHLLEVGGRSILERLLGQLGEIERLNHVYVVTNAKFAGAFQEWADHYRATKSKLNFSIINDGSTDDSNKLGATERTRRCERSRMSVLFSERSASAAISFASPILMRRIRYFA